MGIPIKGIPTRFGKYPQLPLEDLYPEFQKVFEAGICAVGWIQYTPYFNDGDTPVFQTTDVGLTTSPETKGRWINRETEFYEYSISKSNDHPDGLTQMVSPLADMIESGSYNSGLMSKFGDNCSVIITPEQCYILDYNDEY